MHYGLKAAVTKFSHRSPELSLTLKGVSLPSDKTGKTPLDFASCGSESFKRIQKGSNFYRRILLIHKPRGTTNYKTKMEKRLGVNQREGYVNRIMAMLNSGLIPSGNSDSRISIAKCQ